MDRLREILPREVLDVPVAEAGTHAMPEPVMVESRAKGLNQFTLSFRRIRQRLAGMEPVRVLVRHLFAERDPVMLRGTGTPHRTPTHPDIWTSSPRSQT